MPTLTGVSHIDLSVTDLDRSEAWYTELFGLKRVLKGRNDDHGFASRYLFHPDSWLIIGLVQHDILDDKEFDEHRIGLDHLSFAVDSATELAAWQDRLIQLDVSHSPIVEGDLWDVLVLRDPDNIQLELFFMKPQAASVLTG